MRSRRLATSGDGVPGAGKVGARAPGWDALARPIVSFHSGMRMRSGAPRGIESGHTRRRTSSSASTGRSPAPLRRAVPRGDLGLPVLCEADLEMQGAFLCASGLSRKVL